MKKLFIGLISIICAIAMFITEPMTVSAGMYDYNTWNERYESYFEKDGFRFFISKEKNSKRKINGEVWVEAAYNMELTGALKIPAEIKRKSSDTLGYNIVGICARGFSTQKITSVTVGANVKEIGEGAFLWCEMLKKVSMPSGLVYLRGEAFAQCTSLKEISIPNKIKTIEDATFRECIALTKVTMKKNVTRIGDAAFGDCYALKNVILSEQLKSLGDSAFIRCRALETITLPASLKSIGFSCFTECANLKKLSIPPGVTKVSDAMCSYYINLKKVVMGDEVTDIGGYAFSMCNSLTDINVPSKLQSIGEGAFSQTMISEFVFPDTLKRIGTHAFSVCSNLREAIISEGVTEIGEYAFGECGSLYKVSIPSTVKTINSSTFYGDSNLTELRLSEGVVEIGETAFAGTNLSNITLPQSVNVIAYSSFSETPFMLNFNTNPTDPNNYIDYYIVNGNMLFANEFEYSGDERFGFVQKKVFDIPSNVKRMVCDFSFPYCEKINLPSGLEYITGISGCFEELELPTSVKQIGYIMSENLKMLKLPESLENFPSLRKCKNIMSVTVPSNITTIPENAFEGCLSLKNITIKGKVTEIGEGAFRDTAITSFTIPDTVKSIGNIYQGTVIDSVVLPAGIEHIEWGYDEKIKSIEIEEGCKKVYMKFNYCTNLEKVILPSTLMNITDMAFYGCTKLDKIKLPSNLGTIGEQAFAETGVTDITIPKGCTYLARTAFDSGTTVRIHKDSKLLNFVDNYKSSGYKIIKYK